MSSSNPAMAVDACREAPAAAPAPYPRPAYAWYVVAVLTLAYMFSFLDRQILAFLIIPIQRDFGLNNTQITLLHGSTFAVFYTFFGLPLGRMADTRSRRGLIAVGFLLWSLMTAASGLAQRFWHLLLCRTGVAVGEATLSPSAYSLITDYFPPQRRATAIGVYSFGIYLGSGLSLVCLGLLLGFLDTWQLPVLPLVGAVRPWQAVFFIVGLPGALCALLLLSVHEVPRRAGAGTMRGAAASRPASMALNEVIAFLSTYRGAFLSLFLGMAFLTFAGYANSFWMITFFTEHHGWTTARAGVVTGMVVAAGGALGAVGGGRLADTLRSRGRADAHLLVALLGAGVMVLASPCYALAGSGAWAAVWLAPLVMGYSAPFGVVAAAVQQLAPAPMRAQAAALFLFVINLVGMGLGPLATGWLRDRQPDGGGGDWLHLALLVTLLAGNLGAVVTFVLGLKPYRRTCAALAGNPETS